MIFPCNSEEWKEEAIAASDHSRHVTDWVLRTMSDAQYDDFNRLLVADDENPTRIASDEMIRMMVIFARDGIVNSIVRALSGDSSPPEPEHAAPSVQLMHELSGKRKPLLNGGRG